EPSRANQPQCPRDEPERYDGEQGAARVCEEHCGEEQSDACPRDHDAATPPRVESDHEAERSRHEQDLRKAVWLVDRTPRPVLESDLGSGRDRLPVAELETALRE